MHQKHPGNQILSKKFQILEFFRKTAGNVLQSTGSGGCKRCEDNKGNRLERMLPRGTDASMGFLVYRCISDCNDH